MSYITFKYLEDKVPEIKTLEKVIENNIVHKNESVYKHTKKVFTETLNILEYQKKIRKNEYDRLLIAVFLHDYGKKFVIEKDDREVTNCSGHEKETVYWVVREKVLDRFNLNRKDKNWIMNFIENHGLLHDVIGNITKKDELPLRKYISDFKDYLLENIIFSIADIIDSEFKKTNPDEYNRRLDMLFNLLKTTNGGQISNIF